MRNEMMTRHTTSFGNTFKPADSWAARLFGDTNFTDVLRAIRYYSQDERGERAFKGVLYVHDIWQGKAEKKGELFVLVEPNGRPSHTMFLPKECQGVAEPAGMDHVGMWFRSYAKSYANVASTIIWLVGRTNTAFKRYMKGEERKCLRYFRKHGLREQVASIVKDRKRVQLHTDFRSYVSDKTRALEENDWWMVHDYLDLLEKLDPVQWSSGGPR